MAPSAWPVVGHEWAINRLERALRHGRMRHAYLFTGPGGIGKTTLARALAMALNCQSFDRPCGACRPCALIARDSHPDVTITQADGATLKIDQVRALQLTLALRPYEARYRVAILRNFQDANPNAQDALLKTLEEPSANTVLILTADSADNLLPTIVSRCQPLHLRPLPVNTVREALEWRWGAPQDTARALARMSGGRIGWAIRALTVPGELDRRAEALDTLAEALRGNRLARFNLAEKLARGEKTALLTMLDMWQVYWRDALLVASGSRTPVMNYDRAAELEALALNAGLDDAQRALEATRRTIEVLNKNANTRLALEALMLDFPRNSQR